MHIFLDSTVFQNGKDVFFNNRLSRELLNICRQQGFKFYVSSVVKEEVRRQYEIFIKDQLKNINSAIGAFNTIPNMSDIHVVLPEVKEAMFAFDWHFSRMQEEGIFELVAISNEFLPELIHRSIHRIKPFTEAKQEFRDAVIWFSYAKLAEERKMENCFLITGNTSDYLDKQGKLYTELVEKSERFILFKDSYTLLQADFMQKYKATNSLLTSLKEKTWDNKALLTFLGDEEALGVLVYWLSQNFDGTSAEELMGINFSPSRQVTILGISIPPNNSLVNGVDIIDGEYIVSGTFDVEVQFLVSSMEAPAVWKGVEVKTSKLSVSYDAIYDPESDSFKNLEINSYENPEWTEYMEGRHRVRQDQY